MPKKPKVIAILPAYKASKTLLPFLDKFPKDSFNEIILIDDCSPDDTYELAKKQKGLKVYQTPRNLGYGGNLKMCLSTAFDHGADIIMEIHPDGEYKTNGVLPAIKEVEKGAAFVLGNRFSKQSHALQSGMSSMKYPITRLLTIIDNLILGTNITDLHQGFRVYTRKLLENTNFRATSNNYIFSFEIICQAAFHNLPIKEVPVSTHYTGKKRGASFKASLIYTLQTFNIIWLYIIAKLGADIPLFDKPGKNPECPKCKITYLVEDRKHTHPEYLCKICGTEFKISNPKRQKNSN